MADGEPLASQFVPRCFGVIQKIVVKEHWKYWNSNSQTWYIRSESASFNLSSLSVKSSHAFFRNSRTINRKETNNAVPFSLVSPGAYINDLFVKVQNPAEASGCYLDRVHFRVRPAEEGLLDVVLQGISGERPEKMVESEELLRVGSTVTGFGEVVLAGDEEMRLQAPRDGRKYILIPTDHRSFLDRHESSARMWKVLTAVSGIIGASLLTHIVNRSMGKRDDRLK